MPKRKKQIVSAPVQNGIARLKCGDRLLPLGPPFANTHIIPTAPQEFRWRHGAKAWSL